MNIIQVYLNNGRRGDMAFSDGMPMADVAMLARQISNCDMVHTVKIATGTYRDGSKVDE